MIVRLSLDVSTHVTKSSMCLYQSLDKNLSNMAERRKLPCYQEGRICDCIGTNTNMTLLDELSGLTVREMRKKKVNSDPVRQQHTALTVSDIFDMHMKTANLLRQKAATVSLFSISLNFAEVLRTPIS